MKTYHLWLDDAGAGVTVRVDVVKRYLFVRASQVGVIEGLIRMVLEETKEEDMRSLDFAYTSFGRLPEKLREAAVHVCSNMWPRGEARGRLRAKRFMYSVMNDLLYRLAIAEYQATKRKLGEATEVTR